MSLPEEENQILQQAYKLMRQLETSPTEKFSHADLQEIERLLSSFASSENIDLQKLALIPAHLHPGMTSQHLSNFIIPVERYVGRAIREDQFLITSLDRYSTSKSDTAREPKIPLHFVLENIRSSFNVGSIFRLADCLWIEKIHLCGYSPTPLQAGFDKTSLGTSNSVQWSQSPTLASSLENLRSTNIRLIALETAQNSISLFDFEFDFKLEESTAFVVGNERYGLESSALELCDEVVSVPTFGMKNSLNVSNALSIAGYFWRNQWQRKKQNLETETVSSL